MLPTVEWRDDHVVMVDQRKLPAQETYVELRTAREVARAIEKMVIRGAPAIGVAAAMGLALGVAKSKAKGSAALATEFYKLCDMMAATRPTAVNLFWAIDRMKRVFSEAARAGRSPAEIREMMGIESRCSIDGFTDGIDDSPDLVRRASEKVGRGDHGLSVQKLPKKHVNPSLR